MRIFNPASRAFYALGEVAKPGRYPLMSGEVLSQGLAAAGGPTEFANLRKIKIVRRTDATARLRSPSITAPLPRATFPPMCRFSAPTRSWFPDEMDRTISWLLFAAVLFTSQAALATEFSLWPQLEIAGAYDDNTNRSPTNRKGTS